MLVLIIAIYKRHILTRVCLSYYLKLSKKYGFKIVVAGSEGELSRQIAEGCHYIEVDNFPLSYKNNAMMQEAKRFNPDAVVLLGSDDFMCENVIKHYYKLIEQKEKRVFGFTDLYFYGIQERYLSHFNVGNKGYGAGRYFPKSVLEKINYTGWKGKLNRGLDGNNSQVLLGAGVEMYSQPLSSINGFLVDCKGGFNISKKSIIFVGQRINENIMAQKRIPKKKIDEAVQMEEQINEKQVDGMDDNKEYQVIGTGKSQYINKDKEYTLKGLQAKLLIKQGKVVLK